MTLLWSEDLQKYLVDSLTEAKASTEPMGAVRLDIERCTAMNEKKVVSKGH